VRRARIGKRYGVLRGMRLKVVMYLESLITQHLRIATAILYVALAGELAAMGLL